MDEVTERFERYDYNAAGIAVYNFLWDEVADWFIEASKVRPNHHPPVQRVTVSAAPSAPSRHSFRWWPASVRSCVLRRFPARLFSTELPYNAYWHAVSPARAVR